MRRPTAAALVAVAILTAALALATSIVVNFKLNAAAERERLQAQQANLQKETAENERRRAEREKTEAIGMRIIETPQDPERTEILRDPRSGFIAYVPAGSIKKGEALVNTGGSRTEACGVCHGAELQGLGPVPGIAGRSPSYIVRQMFDMQAGARHGEWADLMKPVVAKLTDEDLVNIAAYVSSRPPK